LARSSWSPSNVAKMNILPAVGFGLLFLYVAKGNKIEKENRRILAAGRTDFGPDAYPDVIEADVGEEFSVRYRTPPRVSPGIPRDIWWLKAVPPDGVLDVAEAGGVDGDVFEVIFMAAKKGTGAIVFHLAAEKTAPPKDVIEIQIEVV